MSRSRSLNNIKPSRAATVKLALTKKPGLGETELEYGIASWGMPYERQAMIGPYYADFLIKPIKLVIEVDGPEHSRDKDATRDEFMRRMGYRVARVPSQRASANPKGVVNLVIKNNLSSEEYETRVLVREKDLAISRQYQWIAGGRLKMADQKKQDRAESCLVTVRIDEDVRNRSVASVVAQPLPFPELKRSTSTAPSVGVGESSKTHTDK